MDISDYREWADTVQELTATSGTTLVLGDTDTGKTTFCTLLVNACLALGRRPAVVDADVGQSEIGPPTCVGMGLPSEPVRALSEVHPAALAFVGSTSPRGLLLEHAAAVRSMADAAAGASADLVVVDTTGLLRGAAGRRLKHAKIEMLAPANVVALQRRRECEPALAPLRYSTRVRVHRLPVPSAIAVRTAAVRTQRRAARFARYFEGSDLRLYSFDDVAMTGTWLGTGTPVAPHLLRFLASALGVRVFYAEEGERHLAIAVQAMPAGDTGMTMVQEQFRPLEVTVTPAAMLRHILAGLSDGNGKVLGLGLLESIDFRRRQLGLLTPIRSPVAVRRLQLGLIRVRPDGSEVGFIHPGEV